MEADGDILQTISRERMRSSSDEVSSRECDGIGGARLTVAAEALIVPGR